MYFLGREVDPSKGPSQLTDIAGLLTSIRKGDKIQLMFELSKLFTQSKKEEKLDAEISSSELQGENREGNN